MTSNACTPTAHESQLELTTCLTAEDVPRLTLCIWPSTLPDAVKLLLVTTGPILHSLSKMLRFHIQSKTLLQLKVGCMAALLHVSGRATAFHRSADFDGIM